MVILMFKQHTIFKFLRNALVREIKINLMIFLPYITRNKKRMNTVFQNIFETHCLSFDIKGKGLNL